MSNPLKGAVAFKIDADNHSLSFSAEALYRLEKQLGKTVNQIGELVQNKDSFNMELVRTMFWAGLLDEQDDPDQFTVADAGKLFRKLQMIESISLVTRAFSGAFTDPDEKPSGAAPLEKSGDPQ